ncbi:hypothetical protein [Dyella nitratireducens]|uniref:Lipoprotein n=1 Tax=Dyella nitratireducens TaxID=1849580 RepID=A0ABQ1FSR5_9GAMM|nr:hypothetical protein [Dyella nitratireducens]GGA29582.1 hypothetical protein GCM10010981_18170 [Dyella nitratireducens]GLQ43119.1 hypothetical protein GCM10007902_29690 [Dyella nitratireducens]
MKRLRSVLGAILVIWVHVACASQPPKTEDCPNPYAAFGLQAFNEPTLTAAGKSSSYFAVRFTYLPTFRHPITLRYEENGPMTVRRVVVLTGRFGYSAGDIGFQNTDKPSRSEIDGIKAALNGAGFWTLPATDNVMGADGDILTIEVVDKGECKALSRWQPDSNAASRGLTKLVNLYTALFERAGVWRDVHP